MLFAIASTTLIVLGFLASGYFVLDWSRRAISQRKTFRFSALTTFDFIGLPAGIFVLYAMTLLRTLHAGSIPPADASNAISRILSLLIFDSFVIVRAIRWIRIVHRCEDGAPLTLQDEIDAS
jgi:hypothetical protein